MASKKAALNLTPALRKAIHNVRSDVFGNYMNTNSRKSAARLSRKQLTGTYLARYYPTPISTHARKVSRKNKAATTRNLIYVCGL